MPSKLKEAEIAVSDLLLDPNNPRYADVNDLIRPVPERRVHEESVQASAMQRMLDGPHDVQQLRSSIETIGFLHVDRLVAVELPEKGKFMVIEGNRRLAALKSLIKLVSDGNIDLEPQVRESIDRLPVLVIEDENKTARDHTARVLQGVRHVAGVKTWGPYQEAQLIALMLEEGKTMLDIKQVLGLTAQRINILRRSYYALSQMREDTEYGDAAKPGLFSHFDEALKQPPIRAWLGWDDTQNKCANEENRQLFYAWCVGMVDEDGVRQSPKIVDAKDSRRLPALIANEASFRRFCEDLTLKLRDVPLVDTIDSGPDWRGILAANVNILQSIPALALAEGSAHDIELLEKVKAACDALLRFIPREEKSN